MASPRITMISKLPQSQASTVGGRRTFYRDRTRETLEICHMRCFCLITPPHTHNGHFRLEYTKTAR